MPKVLKIFSTLLTVTGLSVIFLLLSPQTVRAQSCHSIPVNFVGEPPPSVITNPPQTITIRVNGLRDNHTNRVIVSNSAEQHPLTYEGSSIASTSITLDDSQSAYALSIRGDFNGDGYEDYCSLMDITITPPLSNGCTINFEQNGYSSPACLSLNTPITIRLSNVIVNNDPQFSGQLHINTLGMSSTGNAINITNGSGNTNLTIIEGTGSTALEVVSLSGTGTAVCRTNRVIQVKNNCTPEEQQASINENTEAYEFKICSMLSGEAYSKCIDCVGENEDRIWTALGCIPTTPDAFVSYFLTFAIGIGGGMALLLMIYGAFLMATSGGNPEAAQKGKQVFGGAIMGLLFIIFSVVLLNIIGVEILHIPGF